MSRRPRSATSYTATILCSASGLEPVLRLRTHPGSGINRARGTSEPHELVAQTSGPPSLPCSCLSLSSPLWPWDQRGGERSEPGHAWACSECRCCHTAAPCRGERHQRMEVFLMGRAEWTVIHLGVDGEYTLTCEQGQPA